MSNSIVVVNRGEIVGIDKQFVQLFINTKRSEHTQVTYRNSIDMFLQWCGCGLRQVTAQQAYEYHEYLKTQYNSLHSIKLHINVIKSLYSFLIKVNAIPTNPFAIVVIDTPAEVTQDRILDEFEVQSMIRAKVKNKRDTMIIRVLYGAGLRASELCALNCCDLNKDGVLNVRKGKGQKQRFVTLGEKLADDLTAYCSGRESDSPMFQSQKGGHLTEVQLHRIVKAVAKVAGVNGEVSAHWLRHAHASHALDKGAKVTTIRDTLGHASIATTNKYLHSKKGESSSTVLNVQENFKMLEIIKKSTGESVVYTDNLGLDKAYAVGVPELLVLNVVNRVLAGNIEPTITDGGMKYTVSNNKWTINFYDNKRS